MNYVSIIPARAGSKGISRKNIQEIQGIPMVAYTFDAAIKSQYIEKSYVTTDDENVIKIANEYGVKVPFVRPKYLSGDESITVDVVLHFLEWYKIDSGGFPENFVLLQPTSPFRDYVDIDNAITQFKKSQSLSLFSACEVTQHPFEMFHIDNDKGLDFFYRKDNNVKIKRRQNYQNVYFEDGAIYICNTKWFLKKRKFFDSESGVIFLNKEHSIDIDEPIDLELARAISRQKNKIL
jgi:CMP-N,N'-diacetyllegionaminic acid synthase